MCVCARLWPVTFQGSCSAPPAANLGPISTKLQCAVVNVLSVFDSNVGNLSVGGTDRPPELELKNAKGLSNENLQNLQSELTKLAAARCGEVRTHRQTESITQRLCLTSWPVLSAQVMIYELADHIQGFLSEHNKPPPRSFHEEMLKNQRRQQEKREQEEQQRMDQQRRQEEEMVRRERPTTLD